MSFSASVPPVPVSEFDAAVDSAPTKPPYDKLSDESKALVDAAKAAIKSLATNLRRDDVYRSATLTGHASSNEPGVYPLDNISITVSEITP